MQGKMINVLLVEDDPGDVELTREAIEESKIQILLEVVSDGEQAISYLKANSTSHTRPDVILLDLNLPRKDGREVLAEIKQDESLRTIPVVILTTSQADEDILRSYGLGCNCYITKPVGLDQFSLVVRSIEDFWFTVVKLPSR